ncbi:Gfo/Idh/MocA family oxidoreductase [Rhizobium sp. RU36D]|uniref:Gfo/Idh/MocA family protein n=1 Tax=Rhizobium sp. RU36D TaxID=1907415 RepID=UPI0009D817EB|nr:Gfo/Idh/MocA family oxidoreductase [Rhizobium sp. RU36D]SMD01174.1 Predicted dehydrogenase [Rhizobium sp. RU36D]
MSRLRVGIIGLGMAAGHHARSFADLADKVEVAAAFSPTASRREAFAKAYGFPTLDNADAIFGDATIDAVAILTPPNTHLELVERAAKAGKHILLEKPLDITLERAEAIVAVADAAGVTLSVMLQNRYRPAMLALEKLLLEGRLGELVEASASIRNWRPQSYYDEPGRGTKTRDGGGVLLTQGVHTIDLLLTLAGIPTDVKAFARTSPVHRMETEDQVCAALCYANGAMGTLTATTTAFPGYPEQIMLIGTKGSAVLTGSQLEVRFTDGTVFSEGGGAVGSGSGADPMAFGHDLHRALIDDFVTAIRDDVKVKVTGQDALNAQRFIDVILAAAKDG